MYYLIVIIVSICSLSYEIILAQYISLLSGQYVVFQSLCIGIFLLFMGFGARKVPEKSSLRTLAKTELTLSLLGFLSILYIDFIYIIYRTFLKGLYYDREIFISFVFVPIALIGFYTGKEVPLLISITKERKNNINRVFFANYTGGLIGSIILSFFLLQRYSYIDTISFVACTNLCCSLYLNRKKVKAQFSYKNLAYYLCIIAALLVSPFMHNFSQKSYYYGYQLKDISYTDLFLGHINNAPNIERFKSKFQVIDIVRRTAYDKSLYFELYINHLLQFSSKEEYKYHYSMVDLPLKMKKEEVKSVAVLGGGDGLVLRNLLNYEADLLSIDLIELDPLMIDIAIAHPLVSKLNQESLLNKKVHITNQDAYSWAKRQSKKYDFIVLDFPWPSSFDLAKLYSLEFYKEINRLLKPNGIVVIDYPFSFKQAHDEIKTILSSTLLSAKFNSILIWNDKFDGHILASKNEDFINLNPNYKQFLNDSKIVKEFEVYNQNQLNQNKVNKVLDPIIIKFQRGNFYDDL